MATYTLLIPTLNEVEGMRVIMPTIPDDLFTQVLVVDGGSTDGTVDYCRERGIECVTQEGKGLRNAYFSGLPHVRGDMIVTFSPDGNSDTSRLRALVEEMNRGRDMVIVSRYKDWAQSEDDDLITKFGNWLFTSTVNFLLGSSMTDVMVIYRAFPKSLVYELGLDQDRPYRWVERAFFTDISWEPLMSARCARLGKLISEIPGDEPPRIGGVRKLQIIRWGAAYYSQFLMEGCLRIRDFVKGSRRLQVQSQ